MLPATPSPLSDRDQLKKPVVILSQKCADTGKESGTFWGPLTEPRGFSPATEPRIARWWFRVLPAATPGCVRRPIPPLHQLLHLLRDCPGCSPPHSPGVEGPSPGPSTPLLPEQAGRTLGCRIKTFSGRKRLAAYLSKVGFYTANL